MDETDLTLFKSKKKDKHDKADATYSASNKEQNVLQPEDGQISIPEKNIIISLPTDEDEYNCNNPYAGIALIFNHKDVKGQKQRVGTEQDRDAMERTLQNYGYDVRVYNDLTFAELNDVLKKSECNNLKFFPFFFLLFLF